MTVVLDTNQVYGNLWIGSHPSAVSKRCDARNFLYEVCPNHDGKRSPLVENGFEVLVLCADSWQPNAPEDFPGVEVIHAPFDDTYNLTKREFDIACLAAKEVAARLPKQKCLVTCWAGLNRSGLVSALALSKWKNVSPAQAGAVVRAKRENALCNESFRRILDAMSGNDGRCSFCAKLTRRCGYCMSTYGLGLGLNAREKKCDLCQGKKLTKRYFEDSVCWVADCRDCGPLMVVYKDHTTDPGPDHMQYMVDVLEWIGGKLGGPWRLDLKRRSVPDHWHAHLRR